MNEIYKTTGIYRITNKINGKSYIGKTGMNFGDRWDSHRSLLNAGKHDNKHLQSAWNKYGAKQFEFAVVELIEDASKLNEREMHWIAKYRKDGLSYNISDGGDGGNNLGKHLSEETKRKIGAKNRINMTGRTISESTRAKMSASQKKRFAEMSDEARAEYGSKMAACSCGYRWSDDARSAFSLKQRETPNGARLTADDVRRIREKRKSGATLRELAMEYNSSPSYISSIIHRRRWAYI